VIEGTTFAEAVRVSPPSAAALPLVCDSPHSGTIYPADFRSRLPLWQLRQGEDTHVDQLWASAPAHGATLIAAQFPRTYIDANRELTDLDPALLDTPWPEPLDPGEKSRLGFGLVWGRLDRERALYDRKLSVHEVRERIERCWKPYHAALWQAIDGVAARFGQVWHLNLHSMPSNAFEKLGRTSGAPLADFVLGDRDGTTCEPALVEVVERTARAHGYTVARNDPYKGVALIARVGQPAQGRHSLQIELKRTLYMDEATRAPNAGFERLRRCLDAVLGEVAGHVRQRLSASP
jgi:N-formylglutamate deformylase